MAWLLTFLLIFLKIYDSEAITKKFFLSESTGLCENNDQRPAKISYIVVHNENGKLIVQAKVNLTEVIKGQIQIDVDLERCNMEKTKCSVFPTILLPNICDSFNSTFFGKKFLTRVFPRIECPVKAVSKSSLNLTEKKTKLCF